MHDFLPDIESDVSYDSEPDILSEIVYDFSSGCSHCDRVNWNKKASGISSGSEEILKNLAG